MLALNCAAALLLAGLIWYLQAEGRELRDLYTNLRNARASTSEQQQAEALLEETVSQRALLAQSIVTEASLPVFIETLEQVASASGVALELTQATPGSESNPNIVLAFTIEGSQGAMRYFTQLLDALPHQMQIRHARFGIENADYYIELLGHGI